MQDKKYCVYCHTNKINNKKYIGQTCQKPHRRWGKNGERYLNKNDKGNFNQPIFANAILKYGWDNFSHEVIQDNLTQEEADILEFQLIALYNTRDINFGYNIIEGGVKTDSNYMKEKLHEKMKDEKFLSQMAERWSEIVTTLWSNESFRKMQQEKGKQFASDMWQNSEYRQKMCKRVKCIEDSKIYESYSGASRATGIHVSDISRCAKHQRKTAGGLHWELVEEGDCYC